MEKLNKIKNFCDKRGVIHCQSGCILQTLDEHVNEKGWLMPLDLGAKGSCQIGGNIATNAGGIRFYKYGSLHQNVLGMKVVLPNGDIYNDTQGFHKNNTGYHIRNLMIGSEGTLGVITECQLKLQKSKPSIKGMLFSLNNLEQLSKLIELSTNNLQDFISAFELMDKKSLILHQKHSSNLPISIDTCRSNVARTALEYGVEIINDISGLKFDEKMKDVISEFTPSLILCAYSSKTISGNDIVLTKKLLRESLNIAKKSHTSSEKIVLDPAIGFFRKTGQGPFFTKIKSDWVKRDLSIIKNLKLIKQKYPILISVSNKSFLGNLLGKENTTDRLFGSIAAETISVINGADIIRTHNVSATKDAITIASKLSK